MGLDPRWVHHRNSLPYGDDEDNDNDGDDDDDSDNDDGHEDDEDDDGDDDDNDDNDQHMDRGRFGSEQVRVHHRNSLPYGDDDDDETAINKWVAGGSAAIR